MDIIYPGGFSFEDKKIKGIFSFSVYTAFNEELTNGRRTAKADLDAFFLQSQNDLQAHIRGVGHNVFKRTELLRPLQFLYGLTTYLSLVTYEGWEGWKVLIHTNNETAIANPATFAMLVDKGAIIGTAETNLEYTVKQSESILRGCRYNPIFFTDKPVLIRDADTIFDSLMQESQTNAHSPLLEGSVFYREKPSSIAEPEHPFPQYVSRWELYCLQKIQEIKAKNGTTFFIGINDDYEFYPMKKYNNIGIYKKANANVITVPNDNSPIHFFKKSGENSSHTRIRGLAGMVCSLEKFPMDAYTIFPSYSKQVFEKLSKTPKELHIMDELYLSYVLYRYAKSTGKLGFIALNYINVQLPELCNEIDSNPDRYDDFIKVYCSHVDRNPTNLNKLRPKFPHRIIQEMIYLLYPTLHLPDQAFYNPLKNSTFGDTNPIEFLLTNSGKAKKTKYNSNLNKYTKGEITEKPEPPTYNSKNSFKFPLNPIFGGRRHTKKRILRRRRMHTRHQRRH